MRLWSTVVSQDASPRALGGLRGARGGCGDGPRSGPAIAYWRLSR